MKREPAFNHLQLTNCGKSTLVMFWVITEYKIGVSSSCTLVCGYWVDSGILS